MQDWHTKDIQDVMRATFSMDDGLSQEEAQKRLSQNGKNELVAKKRKSIFKMLLEQLKDAMIIILLIASLVSFLMKEWSEGIVILIIVALNAIISIVQEKKAMDAIESLKSMNAPTARVFRDQEEVMIPASELVVGDIVFLEDGGIVPADIRLLETSNLKIDESSLTGESVAVSKNEKEILDVHAPLAERTNMAYASSIITYGTGKGIVVATGMDTEVGHIARMLDQEDDMETPLKKKLNSVGKVLSIVGIGISILIFMVGMLYGRDWVALFMTSISLAISVIPEGLPATATIVMALGVQRMAKKNALVRKLPAVETLGSTSVICSDKTGTLTQNRMTVVKVGLYQNFLEEEPLNAADCHNELLIRASCLCNNASVDFDQNKQVIGDPTEAAFILWADALGFDQESLENQFPRVFEQPFDSERKRMSTIHQVENEYIVYTKGAIEELLALCTQVLNGDKEVPLTEQMRNQILLLSEEMSREALRVLGFAQKKIRTLPKNKQDNIEEDLTLIGIVGMIDPPRKEVIQAIDTCHKAGIQTIMITGDHKITASAIAYELGIYQEHNRIISGDEFTKLTDDDLKEALKKTTVFARISPSDKLRIVKCLQSNGEVVAMTGDGVNDSPALKAADIGIAMGITGTDVSKDASDMILMDDNFTTIEIAIREGRRIYRNIQKVIQYLLAGNIAEVLTIFVSTILNWEAPVLAVHILIINLVTDTLPALALGVDKEDENTMLDPPVKSGSLFEKGLIYRVIFYGVLIAFITLVAYQIGLQRYGYGEAVTMAFVTLSLSQIIHALNQHSNHLSIFSSKHEKNKWLYFAMIASVMILLSIIFIPTFSIFFHIKPLTWYEWIIVIILSLIPLVVVELFKCIKRYLKK